MKTTATSSQPASTLANLQTAYDGESNAHARYLAFALHADQEGYAGVASLFRAAAHAEQIHATNHAAVIRRLGATPECRVETPVVKSTRENLRAALAGEVYERDVMYPAFIKTAEHEGNHAALRTFSFALEAETEHARLYATALENLETMRTKTVFYVCAACGYTVEKVDFDRCPVCHHPKEKFESIS